VTIIPQVNSLGLVNLQILAEVSQRGANVAVGPNTFPSFDIRQAETTAVVQDGETLVIGGIITDSKSRSRTGIPYLMNLPVIGRFFSTTTDEGDRTELIMLITPHVIRNRDESRRVTEDFKKSLSTVRNELERMAREREKLQQKPLERKPALPGPSGDPTPAPNPPSPPPPASGPGKPEAKNQPSSKLPSSAAPSERIRSNMPVSQDVRTSDHLASSMVPASINSPSAKTTGSVPNETGFAALARPMQTSKSSGATQPALNPTKPSRIWVVQVGSHAREKDAESMAAKLREKGYDVNIVKAEVDGKNWYRVQVGQLASQREAAELQKALKDSDNLDQTLIAVR
jgi:flagellar motility protein MotE (MotC chaperone)